VGDARLSFSAFCIVLPVTKLRHALTSPVNMVLARGRVPRGRCGKMPNLLEATDIERSGLQGERVHLETALRHRRLHICGRCTSVCRPTTRASPSTRGRSCSSWRGDVPQRLAGVSPPVGVDAEIAVSSDSVFERITAAELWACTTCRACEQVCPVNIEILDKISTCAGTWR